MAASTSDGNNIFEIKGGVFNIPVAATTQIFAQKNVAVNTTTGLLQMAADAAGLVYAGVSLSDVNNLADSVGGALACPVQSKKTMLYFRAAGNVLATWLGKIVYFLDDQTVGLAGASTNKVVAGRVVFVESIGASGTVIVDPTDNASYSTTT